MSLDGLNPDVLRELFPAMYGNGETREDAPKVQSFAGAYASKGGESGFTVKIPAHSGAEKLYRAMREVQSMFRRTESGELHRAIFTMEGCSPHQRSIELMQKAGMMDASGKVKREYLEESLSELEKAGLIEVERSGCGYEFTAEECERIASGG